MTKKESLTTIDYTSIDYTRSPAYRPDDGKSVPSSDYDDTRERALPVGMSEFNEFAARIIAKAGPYADEDSMRFVLAQQIIHADANKAHYSDNYFLHRMRKAAANQVASQVFQDIKLKAEAAAKKQAEDTALKAVDISDEKEQKN